MGSNLDHSLGQHEWPMLWRLFDRTDVDAHWLNLPLDQLLLKQGELDGDFYILLSGAVAAISEQPGQEPQLYGYFGPGMAVGGQSLSCDQRPQPYSVRVQEHNTRLIRIPRKDFIRCYEAHPLLREILAHIDYAFATPGQHQVCANAEHPGDSQRPLRDGDTIQLKFSRPGSYQILSSLSLGWGDIDVSRTDIDHKHTRSLLFQQASIGKGRAIQLQGNTVVGVSATGGWKDLMRLHGLMIQQRKLSLRQRALFRSTGELELPDPHDSDSDLAVLCLCTGTTRAALRQMISQGCDDFETLCKRSGAARACGCCAERVQALFAPREHWIDIERIEYQDIEADARVLRLYPQPSAHPWPTQAGQHITLDANICGIHTQRSYTLTAYPGLDGANHYEIAVKRVPNGVFSNWIHRRAQARSNLKISPPKGEFIAPNDAEELVYLVGGIGVTPAIAQLRAQARKPQTRPILLDYSGVDADAFHFQDELKQIAANNPQIRVRFRDVSKTGFINQTDLATLAKDHPRAAFLICGPAAFMNSVRSGLENANIPPQNIHIEHFVAPGTRRLRAALNQPKALLIVALIAMIVALAQLGLPATAERSSVHSGELLEGWSVYQLWQDSLGKQITGFTALGLTLLAAALSLRKRVRTIAFGRFDSWRIAHILLGILILITIALHTGLSFGHQLTMALTLSFVGGSMLGAILSLVLLRESHRPRPQSESTRRRINQWHLWALAPLPVLVGMHILSTYYF